MGGGIDGGGGVKLQILVYIFPGGRCRKAMFGECVGGGGGEMGERGELGDWARWGDVGGGGGRRPTHTDVRFVWSGGGAPCQCRVTVPDDIHAFGRLVPPNRSSNIVT